MGINFVKRIGYSRKTILPVNVVVCISVNEYTGCVSVSVQIEDAVQRGCGILIEAFQNPTSSCQTRMCPIRYSIPRSVQVHTHHR